eukprot:4458639-Amphidinium_carterae.1
MVVSGEAITLDLCLLRLEVLPSELSATWDAHLSVCRGLCAAVTQRMIFLKRASRQSQSETSAKPIVRRCWQ